MSAKLAVASFSHCGWQRSNNQDAILVAAAEGIFLLADGMGGHAGGEIASHLACEQVLQALQQGASILDAVQHSHQCILQRGQQQPELHGMGTTLLSAQAQQQHLLFSWLGDSRIYRLRKGQLQQLSTDHSFVQQLIDRAVLTPEEALTHPQRHLLTQALGQLSGKSPVPSIIKAQYQQDDVYLLCSDGVSNMLEPAALRTILHQPQQELATLAEQLLAAVLATEASDNASAILLKVLEAPKRTFWRKLWRKDQ